MSSAALNAIYPCFVPAEIVNTPVLSGIEALYGVDIGQLIPPFTPADAIHILALVPIQPIPVSPKLKSISIGMFVGGLPPPPVSGDTLSKVSVVENHNLNPPLLASPRHVLQYEPSVEPVEKVGGGTPGSSHATPKYNGTGASVVVVVVVVGGNVVVVVVVVVGLGVVVVVVVGGNVVVVVVVVVALQVTSSNCDATKSPVKPLNVKLYSN